MTVQDNSVRPARKNKRLPRSPGGGASEVVPRRLQCAKHGSALRDGGTAHVVFRVSATSTPRKKEPRGVSVIRLRVSGQLTTARSAHSS